MCVLLKPSFYFCIILLNIMSYNVIEYDQVKYFAYAKCEGLVFSSRRSRVYIIRTQCGISSLRSGYAR